MNQISRSAARILDILEFIASRPEGATLTDCATTLQLPKSSALVLLRTAAERGYIERGEDDRFRLNETFRTYGFGWGGHRFARLTALAKPMMEALSVSLEETVILGAPGPRHVNGLAKVVSPHMVRYDAELTRPWPYYCTAMGRTLVAYSPPAEQDALLSLVERKKYSPVTVTDMDGLRRIVAKARIDGFTIVEDEFELGGTGTSAPIFGPDGEILAVMNVGCVTSRYHPKRDRIIAELIATTTTLSHRLASKSED